MAPGNEETESNADSVDKLLARNGGLTWFMLNRKRDGASKENGGSGWWRRNKKDPRVWLKPTGLYQFNSVVLLCCSPGGRTLG